jgi:hypothetical protein
VSDIWHKIKCHIGPNPAFLYGGHDLGRRATTTTTKKFPNCISETIKARTFAVPRDIFVIL